MCDVLLQELKAEYQQRMDGRTADAPPVVQHHTQPRIIRGGSHAIHDGSPGGDSSKPKSLRGGGGRSHPSDPGETTFTKQASTVTSGLISRLLGSGANSTNK